jgi:hypothetical protein
MKSSKSRRVAAITDSILPPTGKPASSGGASRKPQTQPASRKSIAFSSSFRPIQKAARPFRASSAVQNTETTTAGERQITRSLPGGVDSPQPLSNKQASSTVIIPLDLLEMPSWIERKMAALRRRLSLSPVVVQAAISHPIPLPPAPGLRAMMHVPTRNCSGKSGKSKRLSGSSASREGS